MAVLSVGHEDKRNLISRGAIFAAIRRDLFPSKVLWKDPSGKVPNILGAREQFWEHVPRWTASHKCY